MASNLLRVTGMISGMDTESIINAYATPAKTRLEKAKKSKTLNTWTQDAWKGINSKIYGFYSKTLSTNRLSSAYRKTKTTTSNSALSVVAGGNTPNGVQSAQILNTAKAGYLTGNEVKADSELTGKESLVSALGIENGAEIKLSTGGKDTNIVIAENMSAEDRAAAEADGKKVVTSMNDLVNVLKNAGVNANFDTANQRLFVSAKSTGEKSDFSLTADFTGEGAAKSMNALVKLGVAGEDAVKAYAQSNGMTEAQVKTDFGISELATKTKGEDARLKVNGAEFKSSNNTFSINGSTFTINHMPSDPNEEISVTTDTDYDGVYKVVKDMLKEYNDLVKEMSKLYNAPSSKGYTPLTDEQKEEMTDKEIEEWETKIKDSILRKDETLSDVMLAITGEMSKGIQVGDKTMYLSNFGIGSQGYFEAPDNERYNLHIDGDPDDEVGAGKEDKLKAMISSDPEAVTEFFQKLSANLYDTMYKKMSSNPKTSSVYKVYNDKKLTQEATDWDKKIKELEQKVTDVEDKWYRKFGKMESKLAKLQKNQTAVGGFFGG
ncbi:MAG: flagellar filament capping protein FliD [Lachnospiraceae bacterium]|nr:flagellar filament capping protein FliD [Lachnospiraceae bacterium]